MPDTLLPSDQEALAYIQSASPEAGAQYPGPQTDDEALNYILKHSGAANVGSTIQGQTETQPKTSATGAAVRAAGESLAPGAAAAAAFAGAAELAAPSAPGTFGLVPRVASAAARAP